MAGHSHWAGIKHRKGRADKQRSKIFSKLSREITVTAGIDYEFQPQENSLFSINLDGLYSSQQTYGAQAKLYYKSLF